MLAKRLGGRFRYFIGTDLNPETVHQIISETKHGDVVFIDEIHSIHREGAEIFYDVLQDFLYRGEPVPRFTMIGATTDIAKVPKPLRDRCWSQSMEYYSVDELVKIVCQHYPELGKEAALECAKRAHGVPRMALKKLAMHVDAARGRMTPHEVFKTLGVDETGLMAEHRKILSVLKASSLPAARSGATKPVGLEELVFRVDAPRDEVLMYESQLLRLGLVTRTHRGREITTAGIHYCTLGGEGMTDAETQPRGEGEH
jgi:Holliday junction DNA helicase RuvB